MSTTPTRFSAASLHEMAASFGVAVVERPLPDDLLGCYIPAQSRIYLDSTLTPNENRSVLAHELGHVHYGHAILAPRSPAESAAWERRAEAFAARLLIDREEYAQLERISSDPHFLADALDVTVSVVQAFQDLCRHEGLSVQNS